jgi:opacity protein-like surface antigen
MRKLLAVIFALLIAATPAMAQDTPPVSVNFGGGWAFPTSGLRDAFNTGWNGTIGATWNITPNIGIQGEYMYDRLGGPERTITVFPSPVSLAGSSGLIESNHQMHVGTFNLVYTPPAVRETDRPFGAYGIAGGGIYHRLVQLTTPSVGYTTVCDPYWYACYPTLVEVDRIIGDRSSNDFGINIGGGLTFGRTAKFYIESRWHYVWGPKVEVTSATPLSAEATQCPNDCSTSASYFPLTLGVRW